MTRPLGVTILAILGFIGGILSVIVGVMFLALGPIIMAGFMSHGAEISAAFISLIIQVGGAFFIGYGIVVIVVSYGLWVGKGWAWWVFLILMILGILLSLPGLPGTIVGIIINAVIIYYLTRPHVKQYFGV